MSKTPTWTKEERTYREVYKECGSGWNAIIHPLIDFVLDNGGTVLQVKEKFGGLRFYYSPPALNDNGELGRKWEGFEETVRSAEAEARRTCEITGLEGVTCSNGGWLKTLSVEAARELGYNHPDA